MSKLLEAKAAEIEVASLDLGDQLQAEWLALIGITYDPKGDIVEVALEGRDHMIHRPPAKSILRLAAQRWDASKSSMPTA